MFYLILFSRILEIYYCYKWNIYIDVFCLFTWVLCPYCILHLTLLISYSWNNFVFPSAMFSKQWTLSILKPRKIFIWLLILNNKLAILKFMLTVNFSQNLKRLFCYFLASFLAVGKINCHINCHSFVGYLSFLFGYF